MENSGIADQISIHIILGKHHISTRITVKREITISIRISMYKSKSCMHFIIHNKISGIDSTFFDSTFKLFAKHIITYFSDKGSLFTKTVQHGKNIARSPTRIGLESWISLGTFAVFCKVDQKLAESCYIIQSVFHLCFLLIILLCASYFWFIL